MIDLNSIPASTRPVAAAYLVGVDVGTGSARAGIFDLAGRMLASAKREIRIWRAHGGFVEQSSRDIWSAVCSAVREALDLADIPAEAVAAIGFDATCSLVVVGANGSALAVGPSEDPERDIIVWMDHRAIAQAERINAGQHDVLKYVGGRISPEMQTPKLLWLRENRPAIFDAAWQFFDLADFLSWKATGDLARSTCTVTCKWTYLGHENRWDPAYFRAIGLEVLADEGFARIGQNIVEPGTAIGTGLRPEAAAALGLLAGTPVAAGLIDAHAGGLATVGVGGDPTRHMAYVFGTSSCTMTSTRTPVFVPGVWGPYHAVMVSGLWLNEGGQSAAGAAIEQLLLLHPAHEAAAKAAERAGKSLPAYLADLAAQQAGAGAAAQLASELLVIPEFLGNRAPFADPQARAIIVGLDMERDIDSLVALYIAGLCGIGYGLRQIIDAQAQAGAEIEHIVISGGAGQLELVRQILADATGKPVLTISSEEPVLLGSAIIAARAGGLHPDLLTAMAAMSKIGSRFEPQSGEIASLHARKYSAFEQFQALARQTRQSA